MPEDEDRGSVLMLKGPAIFLCFDDFHVRTWHSWLDFFDDKNIQATFYPCYINKLSEKDWGMVKDIQSRGHTIGYHGLNHRYAREMIGKLECQGYMRDEIDRGLEMLKRRGIEARHFAYPSGDRDMKTDMCLLDKFDTLRGVAFGDTRYYCTIEELPRTRLFYARPLWVTLKNLVLRISGKRTYLEPSTEAIPLKNLVEHGDTAIFLYTHTPRSEELIPLLNLDDRVTFYPMSVLDR